MIFIFSIGKGKLSDFVSDLKTYKYICKDKYTEGSKKGEPWISRRVLQYKEMTESEVFDLIRSLSCNAVIRLDKFDDQAFPDDEVFHFEIYNSYRE